MAIARALINRPALLLADEPTGALDSRGGEQVLDMLRTLNREGQTILLVTHDAKLAARYADRVITLRDGAVVDDARLAPAQEPAAGICCAFAPWRWGNERRPGEDRRRVRRRRCNP